MLTIATSSLLFWRNLNGDGVDALWIWGAEFGDLLQHLLTTLGCYQLAAIAIENSCHSQAMRYWRGYTIIDSVALVVTYRVSPEFHSHIEEFTGTAGPSLITDWLIVAYILTTGTVLAASTVAQRGRDGRGVHRSFAAMFALAILSIVCNLAVGFLLLADSAMIARSYHRLAEAFTIPALIVLAAAGVPGLASAWRRRNEPRP